MVQFSVPKDLTQGKQVSISHPEPWSKGGDYTTPSQGVNEAKPQNIVTSGGGSSGKWASGGSTTNVGKQSVKAAKHE